MDAFEHHIDKLLGIVLHNYSEQFGEGLWKVFTWCLNVLSAGLQFLVQPNFEVFNSFVVLHYNEIERIIMAPTMEEGERKQVRSDIMGMIHNMIKDAPDMQIEYITGQKHLQALAMELFVEFNMKNVQQCIRFFGNLFAMNEALCTQFTRNPAFIPVIKRVFTYCTKLTRKEALWLVSNISANSEEDANAIVDSGLFVNLLLACRDSALEMRKEAIWSLSNITHILTDPVRIQTLVEADIMSTMIELLQKDGECGSIASLALTSVNDLLNKSPNALQVFLRRGGEEAVQDLQISSYQEVYKLACEIMERHCGA